ncbi:pentapeptide repeat-containing protein [Yoonia sp. SS1-5]|uniref:Pentapeptide repeat-containing protein n=1 Tax=Yoonia rhodophyticola TaxID=3137370 RepID=A0AAN0M7Q0_9RHOB
MSKSRIRPALTAAKVAAAGKPSGEDTIKRIASLTNNARNTWFSLLGVLLFLGITLLGVEDVDFYGHDRKTQLPLVGVAVPTQFFFWGAPLLVAANYIYFHLYLIRLWDALGEAPARVKDRPLGRAIPSWLVTDAALWLRNRIRVDGSTDMRPLEGLAAVLIFGLTWGLGLGIGVMAWWLSAVARDWMMTGLAVIAVISMTLIAVASFMAMWHRMGGNQQPVKPVSATICSAVVAIMLIGPTYFRTVNPAPWTYGVIESASSAAIIINEDGTETFTQGDAWEKYGYFYATRQSSLWERLWTLAEIDLEGENIVQRPGNWVPYALQRRDFERDWCKTEGVADCAYSPAQAKQMNDEFWIRQRAALSSLKRPTWHRVDRRKPDLRGANLTGAFLAGINLNGARLDAARLNSAVLVAADLRATTGLEAELDFADAQGANFSDADFSLARFASAGLQHADLKHATLEQAVFDKSLLGFDQSIPTNLTGADFGGAKLRDARFDGAILTGSTFEAAELDEVNFFQADLRGVSFLYATLRNGSVAEANLAGANLSEIVLDGAVLHDTNLAGANLAGIQATGADFAGADMTGADFSIAYISGPSLAGEEPLRDAIVTGSRHAGALRNIDLSQIHEMGQLDWRNVFIDGSVKGRDRLMDALGLDTPPCQWADEVLDNQTFRGRWAGWMNTAIEYDDGIYVSNFNVVNFNDLLPSDVAPIPPPDGCVWYDEPLEIIVLE